MEILEAYCEELGHNVEIYEAQEEYFAQPASRRHRFKFRCSDLACRGAKNPLVVGANYHKDAEESEKYQQPHFRSHDKHPHLDACIWVVRHAGSKVEVDTEGEPGTRRPRAKATNVVDVFEPRQSDTPLPTGATSPLPPAVPSEGRGTGDGGPDYGRPGLTTTSRLEKLVDCWAQLDADERRSQCVTVGGRTLTYRQLCLHVTTLVEEENGMRVVYGGARANAWPAGAPTHYYINFRDDCERFPEAAGGRSLTISLPIKRLEKSRRGALLLSRIEQASKPNHYLRAFAWGDIVPRARNKGYEVNLVALDNLVLKVVERSLTSQSHLA